MNTPTREALATLRDSAPSGVDQLMAIALACYDRWEWLDVVRVLEDAVQWSSDRRWTARAFALLALMHSDLADAEAENFALDQDGQGGI